MISIGDRTASGADMLSYTWLAWSLIVVVLGPTQQSYSSTKILQHRKTRATKCTSSGDVVFVLDSSGSVGQADFTRALTFISQTIDGLDVDSGQFRIGLITFSASSRIEFNLNKYNRLADVKSALQSVGYNSGSTNTAAALRNVRTSMLTSAAGDRPNVSNIVVVITDGASNNKNATAQEATSLKNAGVTMIVVAVKGSSQNSELDGMTSPPISKNLIFADTYGFLDKLKEQLIDPICTGACPCLNGGTCTEDENKPCSCSNGFRGTHCEIACPCLNGGTCTEDENNPCSCSKDFIGTHCEIACPCLNGGACTEDKNNPCSCANGYRGTHCELEPCTCLNGGLCPEDGNHPCSCQSGFRGTLCELECHASGDVVFVLDSSGSVGQADFTHALNFISQIIDGLDVGGGQFRIGLTTFSDTSRLEFNLNEFNDLANIKTTLLSVVYTGGATNTAHALRRVRTEMFTLSAGDRPNVPNIVAIITDGESNVNQEMTIPEAHRLKADGVAIVTVAVGFTSETKELVGLTTPPISENLVNVDGYGSLEKVLEQLIDPICTGICPCLNGGLCIDDENTPCNCNTGFKGPYCDLDCTAPRDVIFILDSSSSVGQDNFNRVLNFTYNIIDSLYVESGQFRIGVTTFSDNSTVEINLNEFNDMTDIQTALQTIRYNAGKTHTAHALRRVRTEMFTIAAGDRPNVTNTVVIMTDGVSNVNQEMTIPEAHSLKAAGIVIVTVAIGVESETSELVGLTSTPIDENLMYAEDYGSLGKLKDELIVPLCTGICPCLNGGICTEDDDATCSCTTGFKGTYCESECTDPGDVIFMLDSSTSIGPDDFNRVLNFTYHTIESLDVDSGQFRIGLITFSDNATVQFNLDDFDNLNDIRLALKSIQYRSGKTHTAHALRRARTEMFTTAMGDRPDVPNTVVIITHGGSNVNQDMTIPEAQSLKAAGIVIVTVAIGVESETSELVALTSTPVSENLMYTDDYGKLDNLKEKLIKPLCTGICPCLNGGLCMGGKNSTCMCTTGFRGTYCELECTASHDVVFVLDSSTSVGQDNFYRALNFTYSVVRELDVNNGQFRIGLTTFSSTSRLEFNLNEHDNLTDIISALQSSLFMPGRTNTAHALRRVRTELLTYAAGDRPDIPSIVVIIADGGSNVNPEMTIPEAQFLKAAGVAIVTVAVGSTSVTNELLSLTSTPISENLMYADDYRSLGKLKEQLLRPLCTGICPCMNGGSCLEEEGPTCSCSYGFRGTYCELDSCTRTTCKNGGSCTESKTGIVCQCRSGYKGPRCETVPYALGVALVQPSHTYVNEEYTVILRCQFNIVQGYMYKIRWFSQDSLVKETPNLSWTEAQAHFITDDEFTDLLSVNLKIYCSVDVFESGDDGSFLGQSTAEIFQPLEIDLTPISIYKGEEAVIPVKMNIPFGCSTTSVNCSLQIQLYDPTYSNGDKRSTIGFKGTGTCGVQMNRVDASTSYSGCPDTRYIVITTVNDIQYEQKRILHLSIGTSVIGDAKPYWTGTLNGTLQVTILELTWRRMKYCYSHVDPHMRTFDGRYYENQNIDEFIMYANKEWSIEVQSKTKRCDRRATCSCSCTMKSGGDIFMINHCGTHRTQFLSDQNKALYVYRVTTNIYKIYFPNLMRIIVHVLRRYGYTMNIDIYPAPGDRNKVQGLCGNFNGDPYDDFLPRGSTNVAATYNFAMSWGLIYTGRQSESLQSSHVIRSTTRWNGGEMYCICPNEQTGGIRQAICKENKQDLFADALPGPHLSIVARPWINPFDVQAFKEVRKRDVSVNNTLDMEEAKSLCEDAFKKCPVYGKKDEFSQIDMQPFIDECALDVAMTGDEQWAIPHCDALSNFFTTLLEMDEDFKDSLDQESVREVLNRTCLGNCSGNGICVNGSCICEDGYSTDECLVSLDDQPQLDDISPDDSCDISRGEDCSAITVSGDGFMETPTCRIQIEQADTTGYFGSAVTMDTDCLYVEFNEISVNVTAAKLKQNNTYNGTITAERYGFSISNNGLTFSDFKRVSVIDSACQNITTDENGTTFVRLQPDFCIIDRSCYSAGMTLNTCSKCAPSVSKFRWTNVCDDMNASGLSDSRSNTLLIAVGATSGGVFLALLFTCVWKLCSIRKATKRSSEKRGRQPEGPFHLDVSSTEPWTGEMSPAPRYIPEYRKSRTCYISD